MSPYRLKGTSGAVANQAWDLEQRLVIGTASGCDIQVPGEAVAPRHAVLEVDDGQIRLRLVEDGAELYLNGAPVREAALSGGDEIRIGNCRWLMQASGLKPEKVLTEDAVRRRVSPLPWLIVAGLLVLALAAWRLGYLTF